MSLRRLVLISLSILCFNSRAEQKCEQRQDPFLCTQMRHLKSSVTLLDAQRDLLQVNYEFLKFIGTEVQSLSEQILVRRSDNLHMSQINKLRVSAQKLVQESKSKNIQALITANAIKTHCATCHQNQAPTSGHRWDDIFKESWDNAIDKCNQPGRTPYVCKSMNGLLASLRFLSTAAESENTSFTAIEKNALEMKRIISDLQAHKFLHAQGDVLQKLETQLESIASMASHNDSQALTASEQLTRYCQSCHGL